MTFFRHCHDGLARQHRKLVVNLVEAQMSYRVFHTFDRRGQAQGDTVAPAKKAGGQRRVVSDEFDNFRNVRVVASQQWNQIPEDAWRRGQCANLLEIVVECGHD